MTTSKMRAAALCALLATTFLASPAAAQSAEPAPVRQSVDPNGVDLFRGTLNLEGPVLSIGQGDQALVYRPTRRGIGWWTGNLSASMQFGNVTTVAIGGSTDRFTHSNGVYTATEGNGATLTQSGDIYTYTAANGMVARFQRVIGPQNSGLVLDITQPSGAKLTYSYEVKCTVIPAEGDCFDNAKLYRVTSIRNSHGYRLNFVYSPTAGFDAAPSEVNMENLAAPTVEPITSISIASQTINGVYFTEITDQAGRITRYRNGGAGVSGIMLPGSTDDDLTVTYTGYRVTGLATDAGTVTYAATDLNGSRTVTATDAAGRATVYVFDISSERMVSVTEPGDRETVWTYDTMGRVKTVTHPGGTRTEYDYDDRGNVKETRRFARPGSTLAPIVTSATYDAVCSNRITCNQPNSITDARGQVTEYSYDPNHGGLLTVTLPAPATGAVRPQTRFSYEPIQATFRNDAGLMGLSGEPVVRLTGTSQCQTQTICAGTADEVVTSIAYGPQAAGSGNNQLPLTVSRGSGNGSLTSATTFGYDSFANVTTIDGPLAGSADTVRNRYNAARELIGTVSADPDGDGPLRHHAVRTTIDNRGLTTRVEDGTVTGYTDANWANFSAAEAVEVDYDGARRPVAQRLVRSGTTHALSQTSYNAAGRVECVAQRMNSATFALTQPGACDLGQAGTQGPDRIVHNVYDDEARTISVETGYRTADVATETVAFNEAGQQSLVTDGNDNRTEYSYDGHSRLLRTTFPSATGAPLATDYEELGYDAAGNVVSRRLRDTVVHGFAYDRLNRLIKTDLPEPEKDISYSYDLLGRTLGVSHSDHALSFTWDALGRNIDQVSPQGTATSTWDAAGRRTRLTYPGTGLAIDYDYQVTGEMTRVRENGATTGAGVLATYAYDSRGRRLSLTRGNGTVQTYGYDPVSRLAQLGDALPGTSHDRNVGFTYNPAGQIASATRSNDLFSFTGHAGGSLLTPVNGRNRITSITDEEGSETTSYDARGNMTGDGTSDYSYNSLNQLTGRREPGSAATVTANPSLAYDPLGRLYRYTASGVIRRFGYDGDAMIAEYTGTNLVSRRYVHGAGIDEPLVQYDGAGTATRRWLHADERGSIVARSDDNGAVDHVNTYDEYGVPDEGNVGRFGYTGQAWLPELRMYYYRARMYNPELGRFMQADPIGYGAGLNLYAYVRGDPVNLSDPSGMFQICWQQYTPPSEPGIPSKVINGGSFQEECIDLSGTLIDDGQSTGVVTAGSTFGGTDITAMIAGGVLRTLDRCPEPSFGTFRRAANNAFASNPASILTSIFPFSALRGIRIHTQFAATINGIGGLYHAEISYRNGLLVPYGTSGSVRADGVFGPIQAPMYVVELKSGIAVPTPWEIENYRRHLPTGTRVCGLVEVPGAPTR